MRVTVWGCRGSITTPGETTLRYGGNSTCLEIRAADGQVMVIDAGSGMRNLGKALRRDGSVSQIRLFFTHSHWDHLVGFPFFEPAYSDRFTITMCGGSHAQESIRKYLTYQMQAPYFPVDFKYLKATFNFRCERPHLQPGMCCLGGIHFIPMPLSHPNGGYGFKFGEQGRTCVFLTDNELGFQHEGGFTPARYVDFCRGADLLFHDAQYTDEEYKITRGWGHSTYADATDLAIAANVKRFAIVHHDPDRTDDDLDRQVDWCRERIRAAGSPVDCFAAAEGMTLEV
jgi:phosphoribosyl 1,2-cyclic phosphodiesterase